MQCMNEPRYKPWDYETWCPTCGVPQMGPERVCIVCRLSPATTQPPRHAIELRAIKQARFAPRRLLHFSRFYHTISSFPYLKSLSIKVREQVQQELQRMKRQRDAYNPEVAITRAQCVRTSEQSEAAKVMVELRTQYIQVHGDLCAYCQQPAPNGHFDTVIPSHLVHCMGLTPERRAIYMTLQMQIGNLALACGPCNFAKGRIEVAGVGRLRSLYKGTFLPASGGPPPGIIAMARRPIRIPDEEGPDEPKGGGACLTAIELEELRRVLVYISLRCTLRCDCHGITAVRYRANARTLEFGCPKHVTTPASLHFERVVRPTRERAKIFDCE